MIKKRILVIDDEENFTKLIKMNLEQTGQYEVRTENNGLLGAEVAKEFKPDLIFLDIMMPDIDGAEICYNIKNDIQTKGIPIVFLTAIVNKKEVDRYTGSVGGHLIIAKPVSTEELINVIEKRSL